MSSKQLAALALTTAALAAIGCGSSSKSVSSKSASTSSAASTASTRTVTPTELPRVTLPVASVKIASGKPLTPARWIARGDAICGHLQGELEKTAIKRLADLPRVLPRWAAYVRVEVGQLAKLVPPASKASGWQQYLNEALQWGEGVAKLAESTTAGNAILKSPLANAVARVHDHIQKVAKLYGLKECSLV
jgi:hypothetical protein